jgi:magnesium-transporting ATPase (P-type)
LRRWRRRWRLTWTRGLSSAEAARRLAADGPNELWAAPPVPTWRKILAQFRDPLIYLLLAAVAISLLARVLEGGDRCSHGSSHPANHRHLSTRRLIEGTHNLNQARTAGFSVLVFCQLFNCFNARSGTVSAFRHLFVNRWR